MRASADDFGFFLAFDAGYLRMATALVNALGHFHPGKRIRVLTLPSDVQALRDFARTRPDVEVVPYRPPNLDFGEWHPLVWAKLEAFACEDHAAEVVLDVDQILYRPLSGCVAEALASNKPISASPDITDLRGHVHASFGTDEELAALVGVPCFNAGAMIVRPSKGAYEEILALARRAHRHVRLPEQAILNLWARSGERLHDLGDRLMLEPSSPRILEASIPSCLIHFWTPRPPFFGPSPRRSGEPSWEDCLADFTRKTGQPYPVARFAEDFRAWLEREPAGRSRP